MFNPRWPCDCTHLFNSKVEEPQGLRDHWGWMHFGCLDVKRGPGSKSKGPLSAPWHGKQYQIRTLWKATTFLVREMSFFIMQIENKLWKAKDYTQTGSLPESSWWVQCHTVKCFFTIFTHFTYQLCKHTWLLEHW